MILFTILSIIAIIVAVIAIAALILGGAGFIVMFGDLIVCVVFVVLIMKWIMKRRNK